jgi:hypothetical protein
MNLEKEIRLGNVVFSIDLSRPVIVDIGVLIDIVKDSGGYTPAVITSDRLKKIGFVQSENSDDRFFSGDFEVSLFGKYYSLYFKGWPLSNDIEFIHQVQNIMIDLDGHNVNWSRHGEGE